MTHARKSDEGLRAIASSDNHVSLPYQESALANNIGKRTVPVSEATPNSAPKKSKKKSSFKGGCRCKRSHCLKLYCECYASQIFCGGECRCKNCKNNNSPEFEEDRLLAIQHSIQRDKRAFVRAGERLESPYSDTKSSEPIRKGCGCRKSSCSRNYCVCYNSGLGCMPSCQCVDCANPVGPKAAAPKVISEHPFNEAQPTLTGSGQSMLPLKPTLLKHPQFHTNYTNVNATEVYNDINHPHYQIEHQRQQQRREQTATEVFPNKGKKHQENFQIVQQFYGNDTVQSPKKRVLVSHLRKRGRTWDTSNICEHFPDRKRKTSPPPTTILSAAINREHYEDTSLIGNEQTWVSALKVATVAAATAAARTDYSAGRLSGHSRLPFGAELAHEQNAFDCVEGQVQSGVPSDPFFRDLEELKQKLFAKAANLISRAECGAMPGNKVVNEDILAPINLNFATTTNDKEMESKEKVHSVDRTDSNATPETSFVRSMPYLKRTNLFDDFDPF